MVLGKVLVTVGVEDGLSRVAGGKALGVSLTVNVVLGATVGGEVRRLMDKRSGLGIGAGVGGFPKGTAKVDPSE